MGIKNRDVVFIAMWQCNLPLLIEKPDSQLVTTSDMSSQIFVLNSRYHIMTYLGSKCMFILYVFIYLTPGMNCNIVSSIFGTQDLDCIDYSNSKLEKHQTVYLT
jgi:hypothetical protein